MAIMLSAAMRACSAFLRRRRPLGPSITSSRETPELLEPSKWTPILPSLPKTGMTSIPMVQTREALTRRIAFHSIRSHNVLMQWPNDIPPDLRRRLECVLGHRSFGPADLWGEVRDWLILHNVEPVDLPEDKRPNSPLF